MPKLLILGYARHGKDTVAELLRDRYGLAFQSSSMFCAERVLIPYFASIGKTYSSLDECYEDRVNHRAVWHEQIAAYNREDPARLTKEMFEAGYDLYVGMRSAVELEATKAMFDAVLWVDASGRGLPPEPESSMKISYDPTEMIFVDNSGTLEDLITNVDVAMAKLKKPKLVIVESPYAGDVEANVEYARCAVRHSVISGEAPIASHLLYTQPGILDDKVPEERRLGIDAGLAWRAVAKAAVFYIDRGWSSGMIAARELYDREGFPYSIRSLETV